MKGFNMPSIAIFTFDPQKFDEVFERRKQERASACGKTKILGEWCDTKNGRVVRLVEGGDLGAVLAAYRMWSDLGTLKIFPVTDTTELIDQYYKKR
jgi:predicted ATPase